MCNNELKFEFAEFTRATESLNDRFKVAVDPEDVASIENDYYENPDTGEMDSSRVITRLYDYRDGWFQIQESVIEAIQVVAAARTNNLKLEAIL